MGSIPGSERSPEEDMATHSSVLARRIPWTEESGGLQFTASKDSDTTEVIKHMHIPYHYHSFLLIRSV